MQIRVKNLNRGQRGIYVDGGLVFVDGNGTGTFTGASSDEVEAASKIDGLKVQSRSSDQDEWTDHFKEEMPEEKPWLALATDDAGNNFKPLPDATWYVGMAVSGERPDGPQGYKWVKVGAVDAPVEPAPEPEPAPIDEYAELVKGNMPDVIAAVTAENADAIGKAEENREGGPRKGVMKAVEEAMADNA